MTEVEIAKGLSEAQRRTILDAVWLGSGETAFAVIPCIGVSPLPASLAHMFSLRWDRLTPLGLRIRTILQENSNGPA